MPAERSGVPAKVVPAGANLRGIVFLAVAFFLFAASDTVAKFLTDSLHPIQIVWTRQIGLVAPALVLVILRGPSILRTVRPMLQITRGMLAVLSSLTFVIAIRFVPLADAVAVTFVAPFILTILGAVFLGEHVGLRRWVAVLLGFAGAMIIIRPGLGVFHPTIFLVIASAAIFAVRQILSRALAAHDPTHTTLTYTAISSIALISIPLPFVWRWPDGATDYVLLASMAAMAATAEILIIRAFEFTEAVVVAPVHYSLVIWATFFGWAVFGQLPDPWTWAGTGIIVVTGLYVIYRERVAARRAGQPPKDETPADLV